MIGKLFTQGLLAIALVTVGALAWSTARSAEAPVWMAAPQSTLSFVQEIQR